MLFGCVFNDFDSDVIVVDEEEGVGRLDSVDGRDNAAMDDQLLLPDAEALRLPLIELLLVRRMGVGPSQDEVLADDAVEFQDLGLD